MLPRNIHEIEAHKWFIQIAGGSYPQLFNTDDDDKIPNSNEKEFLEISGKKSHPIRDQV